ncbi:alkaline phosphatase D family protein [Veronia pacifica]|uniref:Alkaline phosphatase n=1 Tax=Veronia pacifica TaxID=1080227 RepID=A0A1C3E9B1_9GAMM|nr:alkaline phosphatase D family protein [Veronia pacifica]ODA29759.1 alkaline phosphatase [Veronia pacifica]
MGISRRHFIQSVSGGIAATTLTGCFSSDKQAEIAFEHGVASGDPTQTAVILWTRVTTAANQVTVHWEVATDKSFSSISQQGQIITDGSRDFTVKVDADKLAPGTRYFYRFLCNGRYSPVGQTKTLSEGDIDAASLAVVSCSNYPAGYFNVYREIVNQHQNTPFDAVLHLGDYIYEYGSAGYATEDAEAMGRLPSKGKECLSLDDYRKRYGQYRSDPDLQALHASIPMIAVWDDHELANDAWKEGAENHDPSEGEFAVRRAAAAAAWVEWLPVRENTDSNMLIYRDFNFGNLIDLYMLDTRVIGRDKPLEYPASGDAAEVEKVIRESYSPNRQLLGDSQKQWLTERLASNDAKWSVLGQQVLMTKMNLPQNVLMAIFALLNAPAEQKADAMSAVAAAIQAYLQLEDKESVPHLPYNLDAWDGYYSDREWLFAQFEKNNKSLISLAGDTHNAWSGELKSQANNDIGVEFATSSVSSPGLEKYLAIDESALKEFEFTLPLLIKDLTYTDLSQRGFMAIHASHQQLTARWHFVSTVKSKDYSVSTKSVSTLDGLKVLSA